MNDKKYHWGSFVKPKGWDGLNNAAINTFNSDVISSFVREMFQNSNDARQETREGNKKKLVIEINYSTIGSNQFPAYKQLLELLIRISEEPENHSHAPFFKHAVESFNNEYSIRVFEFKDYNTKGLSGSDNDAKSTFNACVLSEGMSIKDDDTAGGSYGIGKNSIYGISKIRTILYSSLNEKGEFIFQGVSKLASYKIKDNTHESRIYFGTGEKFNSIRNLNELSGDIQNLVKRDTPGLTQIAICPIEQENWVNEFSKAILRNYWPLISQDELEITLKDDGKVMRQISSYNLDQLMFEYFNPETYEHSDSLPKGNPYDYYSCFKAANFKEQEIHMLGKVKFYYSELNHKKTNGVAFIRNGMVIYADEIWGFGSIGYCGLIICEGREGNILLRMMEPPTHDKFDPSRLNDKSYSYTEKNGRKALDQIRKMIRECLNEILGKYRKKAEDIPWLSNLIKSMKGFKGNGRGNRTGEPNEQESVQRISSNSKFNLDFTSINKNVMVAVANGDESGSGGGTKPLPGPRSKPGIGPNPGPLPSPNKKRTKVKARIFRKDQQEDKDGLVNYKIIISADKALPKTDFQLFQVGDSGNVACFEIFELKDQNGALISFEKIYNKQQELIAYKLKDIQTPTEIVANIKEPYKSTFKIQEI